MTVIQEETALEESSRVVEPSKRSLAKKKGKKKKKKMGKSMLEGKKQGISQLQEEKKMAKSHIRKESTLTNGFPQVADHQLLLQEHVENMQSSSTFPEPLTSPSHGGPPPEGGSAEARFLAEYMQDPDARENQDGNLSSLRELQEY
mmetsp:Transcript_16322/g.25222  ORF Transcript_16322/g.25222 Transcript_16322/m.25222 type:complete len:146 (+) Transcript_16322:195-632(+)